MNSGNGSYPKMVTIEVGQVELRVPRDRDATFDPVMVGEGQRRLDGFGSDVLSLYAKGVSTGDIRGLLRRDLRPIFRWLVWWRVACFVAEVPAEPLLA